MTLPRWTYQTLGGLGLTAALSFAAGAAPAEQQAAPAPAAKPASCEPGYSGSPETGCVDVNECAVSNGGCHRLTACENTPGSRTCGGCPKDYTGDGYVGCFDVNECASPDCSDRMPAGADNKSAPVVTTVGDVTVAATSSAGAAATFTAAAKDAVDGSRPVFCTPASGTVFKPGRTTVTCWAFNKRGIIGRSTLTVTVTQ